jgi:amino acid transporter
LFIKFNFEAYNRIALINMSDSAEKEVSPPGELPAGDLEAGDKGIVTHAAPLARELKGRHLQMIAIGGAIGAGYFVGSGSALQSGGPGSLVGFILCYSSVTSKH